MRTARLPNRTFYGGHHQMSVLVGWGVGPQENKFEQVSSDGHWCHYQGFMSHIRFRGGVLYNKVQRHQRPVHRKMSI